jgi:CBS domain-containing protein
MTSPAVTITPLDDVAEAARVLDRLNITSLPVVDEDKRLLGIIGEADIIGGLRAHGLGNATPHWRVEATRIQDVLTRRVVTAQADDDLASVVETMSGMALKSLPVLLHGRVVGMVSRRDVVRALARGDLDASPEEELTSACEDLRPEPKGCELMQPVGYE